MDILKLTWSKFLYPVQNLLSIIFGGVAQAEHAEPPAIYEALQPREEKLQPVEHMDYQAIMIYQAVKPLVATSGNCRGRWDFQNLFFQKPAEVNRSGGSLFQFIDTSESYGNFIQGRHFKNITLTTVCR